MKIKTSRLIVPACAAIVLAATSITAHAQQAQQYVPPAPPWHPTGFIGAIVASVVFGFIGIVLALVGFKMFDLITPFNLEKEICQEKNIAVGILCAAIVLGICHIIAASMS